MERKLINMTLLDFSFLYPKNCSVGAVYIGQGFPEVFNKLRTFKLMWLRNLLWEIYALMYL
jgi:cobyrinic acid a,c-diamide synthase